MRGQGVHAYWRPVAADWYYMRAMHRTRHLAAVAALMLTLFAVALSGCGAQPVAPAPDAAPPAEGATAAPVQGALPLHTSTTAVVGDERAILTTSKGVIEFTFYPKKAPNTVASIIELARQGFFDGTKFHRVEPGILIQGGDPLSRTDDPAVGTGGPEWRLAAEFSDEKHVEGTVAMARMAGDEDSASSQFYIGIVPLPGLDGQYTVIGRVTKGMDVVRSIAVGDVITSVKIVHGS
ncbi:MAG: peptidylprolyl isomerase [Coriobacteriia bacterium]|nr:peptidylprolyl isomerase [Coriobacteriia bacterium]